MPPGHKEEHGGRAGDIFEQRYLDPKTSRVLHGIGTYFCNVRISASTSLIHCGSGIQVGVRIDMDHLSKE